MNAMNEQIVFDVCDISYAYEEKQAALEHVNLKVPAGESLVILGANGSGKSTLLNLLDGLYFPTSGSICAFGKPLTEEALREDEFNFAFRRRVGLVFQDSDVQLFSASVLDEVAFAPLQLGLARDEVNRRVQLSARGASNRKASKSRPASSFRRREASRRAGILVNSSAGCLVDG